MKENNNLINSRKNSWIKPLYTFFVVALPAMLLWLFFSNDIFKDVFEIKYIFKILIALGFILITTGLTILLIYLNILDFNTIAFVLPVGICFMVIFLSSQLYPWARFLIVFPFMVLVIPINIICQKIELKRNAKKRIKMKLENEKIIGSQKNKTN